MHEVMELKRLMNQTGTDVADIAKIGQVHYRTVQRWLSGESVPTFIYREKVIRPVIETLRARGVGRG